MLVIGDASESEIENEDMEALVVDTGNNAVIKPKTMQIFIRFTGIPKVGASSY